MELGSYSNHQGGRIYLNLSENVERDTMFGTVQHEAAHAWLTGSTLLGMLGKVMYMEMTVSAAQNRAYSADRMACVRLLTERTRMVQEVFANNLELLTIEKQLGRKEMLNALKARTEEYQSYFHMMQPIHQSGLSNKEKQRRVYAICSYAMNVPLPKMALKNVRSLAECLRGNQDPYRRLTDAVERYRECGTLPEASIDERNMMEYLETAAVYIRPYLREVMENFEGILRDLAQKTAEDAVDELMMKKICLFEPAKIRPRRSWKEDGGDDQVFLVLKEVLNLQKEDNFYLIGYDKTYTAQEVEPVELKKRIRDGISACILMSDFDCQKEKPMYFDPGKTMLTVIMQTSEECQSWLRKAREKGTVYAGELRAVSNQTDVSILFFCCRGKPEILYVFPTLCAIRNRILRDLKLEQSCFQAKELQFLSLFSQLNDELEMLKYIQGLLALLLNRSWDALQGQGILRQFIAAMGGNLVAQALRFKRKDYFKVMAALPAKDTSNAPLFTLMRFQEERNTGDTYVDSDYKAPLLFVTKAAADAFQSRWACEYTSVGVDRIYWPYFKEITQKGKAILVLDGVSRVGKLVDVEDISAIWYA